MWRVNGKCNMYALCNTFLDWHGGTYDQRDNWGMTNGLSVARTASAICKFMDDIAHHEVSTII